MTTAMDTQEIARRILHQRMQRFPDRGPVLDPLGSARCRVEARRLRMAFAEIAPGQAARAVQRVLAYAQARALEVQWIVVPQRPGEQELAEALLGAGFLVDEHLLLMAHQGPMRARLNPEVVVEPIVTWQAMWQYEYGGRQAFFDEASPTPTMVTQRARDRWREQDQGWCRYYGASIGGRMVGGAYVSLFEEIPTLMGVYTVPEARGRGVATALIERAVGDLVRAGRDTCCLFVRHGNPAERLYLALGFIPLVDETTYILPG